MSTRVYLQTVTFPCAPSGAKHFATMSGLRCRWCLRPLRNIQPALHRGPRQPTLEPGRDMLQSTERNEITSFIEADQVAHPAEHGDVGDAVLVVHDPLPSGKPRLDHTEQALRFRDIALQRTLVGDLLAGELVEKADLPEHRTDPAHLKMQPLDRFPTPDRIGRQQLAGLLGE